jgi:hypothetical protein
MQPFAGRRQWHATPESAPLWWHPHALVVLAALAACLVIAACGSPTLPSLPAGSYSSATFGFHVSYPTNWKANPCDASTCGNSASGAIPFNLIITRTGDSHSAAALISTCTITVMNMKDRAIAASAAGLSRDKTLQPVTIGGARGYKSAPVTQDIPNSQISVTHTDYFVVHGNYEYQLSTDSVKGDNADADLQSIIASFGFGG